MPIVYVHGVATRDPEKEFTDVRHYLRRFIAPLLSNFPDEVWIEQAYWGDVAVRFAWEGASRPRSLLLGQGTGNAIGTPAEQAILAATMRDSLDRLPSLCPAEPRAGLTSGRSGGGATPLPLRLKDLSSEELSDLFVDILLPSIDDDELRPRASLLADTLAHDGEFLGSLAAMSNSASECELVVSRLNTGLKPEWVGMGGSREVFRSFGDRLYEVTSRALSLPGVATSVVVGELRKGLNDFVSNFFGDVFAYLKNRLHEDGQSPGQIPARFLEKLLTAREIQMQRADEPIVVLSHSMGGQIVYDALTHFMPRDARFEGLRIDYWCATASQVGFFEEAKLFIESRDDYQRGNPVPFPEQHLKAWWNVWDYNDFISFTTRGIIAGVDDQPYHSGMSLIGAHSGYLQRPSFYRNFAERLGKRLS